jgi:hypothetical protein
VRQLRVQKFDCARYNEAQGVTNIRRRQKEAHELEPFNPAVGQIKKEVDEALKSVQGCCRLVSSEWALF